MFYSLYFEIVIRNVKMSEMNKVNVAKKKIIIIYLKNSKPWFLFFLFWFMMFFNFSINLISLPIIKCQKKTNEEWLWWKIIPFCKRLDKIKLHDALHLFFLSQLQWRRRRAMSRDFFNETVMSTIFQLSFFLLIS